MTTLTRVAGGDLVDERNRRFTPTKWVGVFAPSGRQIGYWDDMSQSRAEVLVAHGMYLKVMELPYCNNCLSYHTPKEDCES